MVWVIWLTFGVVAGVIVLAIVAVVGRGILGLLRKLFHRKQASANGENPSD